MKVSVNQPSLSKALGITGRAVSSRTAMPVLANILLEAKGNQLRLAATNREIGINCWIAAKVEDEGAITIPARLLSEFVNSLPPERIDMELSVRTQTLHLSCARFEANIKGIDAFEFPLIPSYSPEDPKANVPMVLGDAYTVNPSWLSEVIDSVTFAASTDENRPTLTGIETTFSDGKLTMAATDGYRLSVRSVDAITQVEKNTVIIPSRSLSEVARICADAAGDITAVISQGRNQILFSATGNKDWQRVDVVSELIDAKFPDYWATVPKMASTVTIIGTAKLLSAVKVAQLFARDNNNILRVNIAEGGVRLSASSSEMGDNVSELDATVEGEPIEISFNAKYLIDALSHIDAPDIALETTKPTRPGMIRPGGHADYYQVLMPMHSPKG